ncbi:hypothetical protein KEM55_001538, partial [Ascosphaera atra]
NDLPAGIEPAYPAYTATAATPQHSTGYQGYYEDVDPQFAESSAQAPGQTMRLEGGQGQQQQQMLVGRRGDARRPDYQFGYGQESNGEFTPDLDLDIDLGPESGCDPGVLELDPGNVRCETPEENNVHMSLPMLKARPHTEQLHVRAKACSLITPSLSTPALYHRRNAPAPATCTLDLTTPEKPPPSAGVPLPTQWRGHGEGEGKVFPDDPGTPLHAPRSRPGSCGEGGGSLVDGGATVSSAVVHHTDENAPPAPVPFPPPYYDPIPRSQTCFQFPYPGPTLPIGFRLKNLAAKDTLCQCLSSSGTY